jgi:predicted DNA binding CopG/RHH family protein
MMKTQRKAAKPSLNDPDLEIPPLTKEQLRLARRALPEETEKYRQAIQKTLGVSRSPRLGRPPKGEDKYKPVYIRLHPSALAWAKREAKRRGIGYQTVINETLLHRAA